MNMPLLCALGTGLSVFAATPTVSNVTLSQNANTRVVTVSYSLDGAAVVTLDIQTNSAANVWVTIGASNFRTLAGDVNKYVAKDAGTIEWRPNLDWPDRKIDAALATTAAFSKLFRLPVKDGNSSAFAGTAVESMKKPFYGEKGHIGFRTRSVERALAWYRAQGVAVREESIRRTADGSRLQSFYLSGEPGGFAVHVVK